MLKNKYNWEVPEIDLNLRHYSGAPTDVIKKIQLDIVKYLTNTEVSSKTHEIYSAIYCALDYYKTISYLPSAEYSTNETFLSHSLRTFNEDFEYLSEKYNSKDSNDLPVINLSARVKSPLGFVEKVKEKIDEYVKENRDLSYFNESLRDLIGVRIIVTPPKKIQNEGLQAESDYLYHIYYDLMCKHGLLKKYESEPGDFKFLSVNTRHNSQKLESIKNRPAEKGFSESITSDNIELFIPSKRPDEIDNPIVDSILKDYVRWPKHSGYQSLHTCVVPDYYDSDESQKLPACIIPQKINDFAIEYQFRTQKQHDFAELGPAAHKFSYKPHEIQYHRLAVPLYIGSDLDYDIPESNLSEKELHKNTIPSPTIFKQPLKLRNFAECYKTFYGHSFKDRFNIDFQELTDKFSFQDINDVLAGLKIVKYDQKGDFYELIDNDKTLYLDENDTSQLKSIIRTKDDIDVIKLFDEQAITDSILDPSEPTSSKLSESSHKTSKLTLIPVITSESRNNNKDKSEPSIDSQITDENKISSKKIDENPSGPDEPYK